MSNLSNLGADLLKQSLQSSYGENVVVKADEIEFGGGLNFEKIYFSPQPGNTYQIKFLPLIGKTVPFLARIVYTKLPDPTRKGKTFHAAYPATDSKNPVISLFFDLHAAKKNGDAVAELKINKYLKRKSETCGLIQIIGGDDKDLIGQVRLFSFHNNGPQTTIADLINQKLKPSKEQIADGDLPENIHGIFGSSILNLKCTESIYGEDKQKGREFTGSSWLKKQRGAIAFLEDGTQHEFSAKDIDEKGEIKKEILPFFESMIKTLTNPEISIDNYFLPIGEHVNVELLTDETKEYLVNLNKKVDEIVSVIEEKSIKEIDNYGKVSTEDESKNKKSSNLMSDSLPDTDEASAEKTIETSSDDDLKKMLEK